MKKDQFKRSEKLDKVVTAKVHHYDLDTLKNNNVNVSKVIQAAISDAAKKYRQKP